MYTVYIQHTQYDMKHKITTVYLCRVVEGVLRKNRPGFQFQCINTIYLQHEQHIQHMYRHTYTIAKRRWNHDISCVESGVVWAWYCYKQLRLHFSLWPVFLVLVLGSRHLLVAQNQYHMYVVLHDSILINSKHPPLSVMYIRTSHLHYFRLPFYTCSKRSAPCGGCPAKGPIEWVDTTFPRWFTSSSLMADCDRVKSKKPHLPRT